MRCLSEACAKAAVSGVKTIILGGAGLAGYAQGLRMHCPVPLIDSAEAGLQVMLQGLAPPSPHGHDGFFAQWCDMAPGIVNMPVRP